MQEDQAQTRAFLASRGESGAAREIVTHISRVFLCGAHVFKLKRAVKLPYLDFSTPELRLAACEQELALNLRSAPQLYLAVRRITRIPGEGLEFDGEGELADAVVEMRAFAQDDLFDAMAQHGRLDTHLLTRLARKIAAFHAGAMRDVSRAGSAALEAALAANEGGFGEAHIFDPEKVAHYFNLSRARFERFRSALDKRGVAGFVRRGHGDLHLRNICLYEGEPVLFDCLEFDEALATTDVLYDLAFLLMDLVHRGLASEANLVFNRYIDATGDDEYLAMLPFLMGVRAAVRAHVGAAGAGEAAGKIAEAQSYLDLALDLFAPHEARLVAVGGLSGSGKSSIAAGLAPQLDLPPGARILSTDRIRKQLAGIGAEEKLPPEAYTPESSLRVYAEQRAQAARVLAGGGSVVVDGVFLKEEERRAIAGVARAARVRFDGLWLQASRDVLTQRIGARHNDPSDATVEVLDMQMAQASEVRDWRAVEASQSLEECIASAWSALA